MKHSATSFKEFNMIIFYLTVFQLMSTHIEHKNKNNTSIQKYLCNVKIQGNRAADQII